MKIKTILLGVVVCLLAVTTCYASDPNMGTWKLNEAKSKLAPGAGKNTKVVYAASGYKIKVTVEGIDAAGKPTHNEWTGKFDGKDYPVTGDATSDARSYKKVNDRTLEFAAKKGGKTTVTGTVEVAADGKSRTVTLKGTDAKGKPFTSTSVYDKQ
ncbi:MAG TPA: hypothetical protein VMT28_13680 [Terriglobales bacterium]|nr:hypothetical protein [Terriglobales bacterium]